MGPKSGDSGAWSRKMPHVGKPGAKPIVDPGWWNNLSQNISGARDGLNKQWTQTARTWKKSGKFQLPGVKVDVDFLNPVMATVKESSAEIWARLPAPVQQHGPIIGAVLLTALVVHRIDKGRLRTEQKRNLRLRGQVDQLLGENEDLHKKASDWKARAHGPKSPSELEMSRALSEATQAAAAAATSAARAATACGRNPYAQRQSDHEEGAAPA